ncbi:hypothetical protein NL108_009865 [Boleophthalmus pectinirostris]|nr:hypothetical protein NL108_009865 [Boleophthalmus pectinirostris]
MQVQLIGHTTSSTAHLLIIKEPHVTVTSSKKIEIEKMEKGKKGARTSPTPNDYRQVSTNAEPVRSQVHFKILSCNINGLKDKQKKNVFIKFHENLKADIGFLQETHLQPSQNVGIGNYTEYSSSYTTRSCGVAILVKKTLNFELMKKITDEEGRWIIVHGLVNGISLTLVSIYGPTEDDPNFFEQLFLQLEDFENIIIGGDFNTDMASTERSSGVQRNPNSAKKIKECMKIGRFVDIWRNTHTTNRHTYSSKRHHTSSRIDYFLINESLVPNIIKSTIHNTKISDHSAISLTLKFTPNQNNNQ